MPNTFGWYLSCFIHAFGKYVMFECKIRNYKFKMMLTYMRLEHETITLMRKWSWNRVYEHTCKKNEKEIISMFTSGAWEEEGWGHSRLWSLTCSPLRCRLKTLARLFSPCYQEKQILSQTGDNLERVTPGNTNLEATPPFPHRSPLSIRSPGSMPQL